jgi:hypothetical protein
MDHIFMVKLLKVKPTGKESLLSQMALISRETGKMINHMVMESTKHQLVKYMKVISNMV